LIVSAALARLARIAPRFTPSLLAPCWMRPLSSVATGNVGERWRTRCLEDLCDRRDGCAQAGNPTLAREARCWAWRLSTGWACAVWLPAAGRARLARVPRRSREEHTRGHLAQTSNYAVGVGAAPRRARVGRAAQWCRHCGVAVAGRLVRPRAAGAVAVAHVRSAVRRRETEAASAASSHRVVPTTKQGPARGRTTQCGQVTRRVLGVAAVCRQHVCAERVRESCGCVIVFGGWLLSHECAPRGHARP